MNNDRRQEALEVRTSAAKLAADRSHPRHIANSDEQKFRRTIKDPCDPSSEQSIPSYLASFTKGMPHDLETGLIADPKDFQQFVKGIDSGDPRDFQDTRLGPLAAQPNPEACKIPWQSQKAKEAHAKVRAWESQGAGNTFDLEGPDAQAVTMPPAPELGSDELIGEMGEVYAHALLRDVPFTEFTSCCEGENPLVDELIKDLNRLRWFRNIDCCELTPAEASRKRGRFNRQTVFRSFTPGNQIGPYISQFLLAGNAAINGKDKEPIERTAGDSRPPIREASDGLITYGALNIDQQVRFAKAENYMTTWKEWIDVQDGADLRALEEYTEKGLARRFITTPRDLATYVHYDALYEAYLNACLILIGNKIPFDPGIPFQARDSLDHQQGFAHFGGPHILSLVTEVATRALKAVRFQKFNVHRRLRPEVLAARISKYKELRHQAPELTKMFRHLRSILAKVNASNGADPDLPNGNFLLPMAFCEGSPMHPAYGAGHATVAGACVTILKAFFDHKHPLNVADPAGEKGFVAIYDDSDKDNPRSYLKKIDVKGTLTVEGELNKLASNISIGRDWAGVHYFSDYIESIRMGEQIALGILEEQKLTYGENFSMTVPLFNGDSIRI